MTFKPNFVITNTMVNNLTRIVRVKGFLDAITLSEDHLREMQNRALVLEAHHTTHIEGTQLTLEQSEKLLEGKKIEDSDPNDEKELINYRDAFDLVSGYLGSNNPVTQVLIRDIHKCLVRNVRGNSAAPGEYRKIQNYVVNSKSGKTIYIPPPVFEIQNMMQNLVDYINKNDELHPVLISGIAQFQLVHIHPFLDGNGRVARLLSTLCLYQKGYDFKKLFTISEFYDRNRIEYYNAIQSVRDNDMNFTIWLEYFTHALAEQLQEIKIKSEIIVQADTLAKRHNLSTRQAKALQHILQYGELTIKDFEKISPNVARRSLQRDLKILIENRLVMIEGATNQLVYKLMS